MPKSVRAAPPPNRAAATSTTKSANSGHHAGVVPASGPTRNGRSTTFRESGTLSSTKAASTTSGRNPTTSSCVSMTPAGSEPASSCSFCAQLRGAPRSNPAQQRHAKGETVSHAEFIALLRVKAPKPTVGPSGALRCEKDILMTREATSLPATSRSSRTTWQALICGLRRSISLSYTPLGPAVCQCGSRTAASS